MSTLLLVFAGLALVVTQMLAGGREIALCLPGYALLIAASVLSFWHRRTTLLPKGSGQCLAAAVLLFSYVAVRAFLSPEEYLARADLYAALSGLVMYLLIALHVTSSRRRFWLVGALLLLAVVNCAIGAIQFFKGQEFMPFSFLARPTYGIRASGFYGYPNHLAGFLEMVLPFGLSGVFWGRCRPTTKMLMGYASIVIVVGILITQSRGGYISATVGVLIFIFLSLVLVGKLASGRAVTIFLAGVLMIGTAGWFVRQAISQNYALEARAQSTLTVDSSRVRHWQAAWKQFHLNPAVGTGSGTYLYYGRQFRHPEVHTDPVHAHNDYVELLAEYGIAGFIALLIFVWSHLRRGYASFIVQLSRKNEIDGMGSNRLALVMGALGAAAACLTHCFMDFNLHMQANFLMAAIVFAFLAVPAEESSSSSAATAPVRSPFLRFALPVVGIWMAVQIGPTAPAEYFSQKIRPILADWHRSVSPGPDQEMEALARRGLAWNPRHPDLYFAMAQAQSAMGDLATDPAAQAAYYRQAVESYQNALRYAPGNVFIVISCAVTLDSAQRFLEAEPLYQRAIALDPLGKAVHVPYGNHLVMMGKFDEAAAEFRFAADHWATQGALAGFRFIEEEKERLRKEAEGKAASPEKPAEK